MSALDGDRETVNIITSHKDLAAASCARRSSSSRSFVLAALRALHLDRSHAGGRLAFNEVPSVRLAR
jgi:hypothetical protein